MQIFQGIVVIYHSNKNTAFKTFFLSMKNTFEKFSTGNINIFWYYIQIIEFCLCNLGRLNTKSKTKTFIVNYLFIDCSILVNKYVLTGSYTTFTTREQLGHVASVSPDSNSS